MDMIAPTALIFISLLGIISFTECLPSHRRLFNSLQSNKGITIPATNVSVPLDISVWFSMNQIVGFDQLNQVITLVGTLSTSWHDNTLAWAPAEFDDIDSIVLPTNAAWTPDIVLFNAVDRSVPTHDSMLKVTSNGDVSWITKNKYSVSCASTPDEEEPSCDLKFGSWSLNADIIKLTPQTLFIDAGYYLPHHEWELSTTKAEGSTQTYPCCPDEKYSDVTFTFILVKREEEEEDDPNKLCNSGRNLHVDIILPVFVSSLMFVTSYL